MERQSMIFFLAWFFLCVFANCCNEDNSAETSLSCEDFEECDYFEEISQYKCPEVGDGEPDEILRDCYLTSTCGNKPRCMSYDDACGVACKSRDECALKFMEPALVQCEKDTENSQEK